MIGYILPAGILTIVGIVAFVALVIILIFVITEVSVRRSVKRDHVHESARQEREARLEEFKKLERIKGYPVKELTQEGFDKIPKAESLEEGFLKTCPIGFWFVCRKSDLAPNITVIGQVVKGNDAFCDQVGAALLSLGKREINRYQAKIVEAEKEMIAQTR